MFHVYIALVLVIILL